MIDPRNMPCARVCLPRLSAGELPPNAQEQYHSYAVKRKSSRTSLNAGKDATEIGVSSPSPVNFLFVSGVRDQAFTSANSSKVARDTGWPAMSDQYVPGNNTSDTCTSTQISPSNYTWPPIMKDYLDTKPDNTTVNTFSTKRRNSVVSTSSRCSSGSSKGRELVASVCLTPVTLKTPGYTSPRPYEHCMPETELECSEVLSDVTDDSTLSGAESAKNFSHFVRKKLQSQDFSYEKLSVTSSLSTAVASGQDMDQSTYSSSFASFSDHIMYGCEDMWPDLQSYSPPESPDPQETEIIVSEDFSKETSGIEDPIARIQPANSEKSGGLYSPSSDIRCFSVDQNGLLYPEIKLAPLEENSFNSHNDKRTFPSSESACKRRSLSGNLLVKIEDVGEKLKPCASGGLTVVTNSAKERYTSSGRRIANSYSEKSLAKLSITRALNTQVKKRKVRSKVVKGPSLGGDTGLISDLEHLSGKQGKKRKRQNKNSAGRKKNILSRYENLKFSELNTVPRMSVRYKVAFTKWPYVFSGALDLINQRLSSQNAFWDSLRS